MIRVENLTKNYGKSRGVSDISFTVNKGEVVGFLGPNGAGKTTTMKILTGYFAQTHGKAYIAGIDVLKDPLGVKRQTGYLPENTPLYQDMGVIEYLKFIAQLRQIHPSKIREHLAKVIEDCGLKEVLHKDIYELSKGYRQRVGIAQALIHEPAILILDEPTSGLDPSQIIDIRNLIKKLGQEKTIILSTHILPEVSATCNRIIIINNGKIVASGTPKELSKSQSSGTIIKLTFKGDFHYFSKLLKKKYGYDIVIEQKKYKSSGWLRLTIQLSQESVNSEEIFSIVAQNKWLLSELKAQELTLEDIFLNITTQENQEVQ
ncbi:MAG: ABC transporter [Candidatus Margulisiibacteriota bacterium]|nr:MAG: ABC transporter [Candidatus Margulisbacteria bacterium GWD2_39_127]OGI01548.1 MAG: ABC transporter [Candidatus Margulisbacteria bacterium GWF2_38_17]OGI09989.1 MAG: ABC transporter [Candidatus Margulisbacteria bacterium GWE2_39_32]PZM78243.1 MAG: ABC transporter [Candidatus Margulisiibacteriota bacterium]HAR61870.1 ABC transporter [Candidatus Margulisiibacteriota bacterium]